MSQVSHWAAKPLAGSPTGSHLALDLPGNARHTSDACRYPRVALYWILIYSILISSLFVSLIPFLAQHTILQPPPPLCPPPPASPLVSGLLSRLALMTKFHVCFLMRKHSSCPPAPRPRPNNSALMETFNIACWSPLGAVDGLLSGDWYVYMGAGQTERGIKAWYGVNKGKSQTQKQSEWFSSWPSKQWESAWFRKGEKQKYE